MSNSAGIPTLGAIAKATGYSIATVSLVLRDKPGFTPETVNAIKSAAESLGYAPNRFATALRPENSRIVGYLLPNNQSRVDMERWAVYDLTLLTEFTKAADKAGYTVVAIPAGGHSPAQFSNLRAVYAPDHISDEDLEMSMGHSNIPLIAHNYHWSYAKVIDIYFTFREAGLDAVKRLFDAGATTIGLLIEPHIAEYVDKSEAYVELKKQLPGDVVVYGREYREFNAAEVLDAMIADGVDAVYSNLEVGKELLAEISVSTKSKLANFKVVPTVDLAYTALSEMWLRDEHVFAIAAFDSSQVYDDLFDGLDEYLGSNLPVVKVPVEVVVHEPTALVRTPQ